MVDKTSRDVAKIVSMAKLTFAALNEYFFVRGSPFMGLLFALPVLMSIYSLVLAGIFTIIRSSIKVR
jgi:hypothetical protein